MILQGDCRDVLKTLPDKSVHCVVTSPPYWGLRSYGHWFMQTVWDQWGGTSYSAFCPPKKNKDRWLFRLKWRAAERGSGVFSLDKKTWIGALGLEPTPELYVTHVVQIFREIKRVLRDDGTLWLNLGDSYVGGGGYCPDAPSNRPQVAKERGAPGAQMNGSRIKGQHITSPGLKPKDLRGIPWRVAFALQADGWYLRSDIIWHKPNPMPGSVTDRPTKSHEYVFLMSKSARYFYDNEAVKVKGAGSHTWDKSHHEDDPYAKQYGDRDKIVDNPNGANLRSVWTIATQPSSEAHFAMFPEALVVPCIKAGTSEHGVCSECGAPWERVVEKTGGTTGKSWHDHSHDMGKGMYQGTYRRLGGYVGDTEEEKYHVATIGFRPTCKCGREDRVQATVLDPFSGMATVGVVCNKLGRKYIGIELNPKYADRSEDRKDKAENLFSDVV